MNVQIPSKRTYSISRELLCNIKGDALFQLVLAGIFIQPKNSLKMEMIYGCFVSKMQKITSFLLVLGCTFSAAQAQDTLVVPKRNFTLELNYGQLHPLFRAYPAGHELNSSGFWGLRMYSNILAKGKWTLIAGGGAFINREKWSRQVVTEQDIMMGTETHVDSRLSFYGAEMLLGVGKSIFRDKISIRASQGLVYIFGVDTEHTLTFGYSGQVKNLNNFPYRVPALNTNTILSASYNLDAILRGLELGLSLQHIWLPMQYLMTSAEGGRSHYLIHGRYTF